MINAGVRHENKILAGILLLALGLRVWGIQFGLPGLFHADEPIVLNHALAYATGDFNPHFFKIPPLVSYLLFAVFGVYYLAGHAAGWFSSTADFENFFYSDPSSFYLLARVIFGALAGTLTVLFFYRSLRRHFGSVCALTGSFLLAVCFLHVTDSHYLYADIPLLLVMVIAFGFFWDIRADSGPRRHLGAGALVGAAAALKYNGVFIALFYAVILLGLKTKAFQKMKQGLFAAATAAFVFFLLNPYAILDARFFLMELQKQSASQGGVGWFHHGIYSLPGAVGLPILAAAAAGVLRVFGKNQPASDRLKKTALLVFTVGYYAVLAWGGQPYPRYVLPLLPGILFFAAEGLIGLSEKIKPRRFLSAGLAVLCLFPLTKSVLWDRLMSAEDVRAQAKVWIESHIPPGTPLALDWDFYMPRLQFTAAQLEEKQAQLKVQKHFHSAQGRRLEALKNKALKETAFGLHFLVPDPEGQERFLMAAPAVPYDLETLKSLGIQYVLLSPGIQPQEAVLFYEQVQKQAQHVKFFSPYQDGRKEGPLDKIAMTGGPFTWAEIIRRERNGHAISIYQIG